MAEPIKSTRVVYGKQQGAIEMYAIDAHHAVSEHPGEWSFVPWDESQGEGVEMPNGSPRAIVPNGWIDLPASQKIQLARDLGGEKIKSGAQADDFINEYLVDRANAGAAPAKLEPVKGFDAPTLVPAAPSPLGPVENNPKG
jgi:hypothetical protein